MTLLICPMCMQVYVDPHDRCPACLSIVAEGMRIHVPALRGLKLPEGYQLTKVVQSES